MDEFALTFWYMKSFVKRKDEEEHTKTLEGWPRTGQYLSQKLARRIDHLWFIPNPLSKARVTSDIKVSKSRKKSKGTSTSKIHRSAVKWRVDWYRCLDGSNTSLWRIWQILCESVACLLSNFTTLDSYMQPSPKSPLSPAELSAKRGKLNPKEWRASKTNSPMQREEKQVRWRVHLLHNPLLSCPLFGPMPYLPTFLKFLCDRRPCCNAPSTGDVSHAVIVTEYLLDSLWN